MTERIDVSTATVPAQRWWVEGTLILHGGALVLRQADGACMPLSDGEATNDDMAWARPRLGRVMQMVATYDDDRIDVQAAPARRIVVTGRHPCNHPRQELLLNWPEAITLSCATCDGVDAMDLPCPLPPNQWDVRPFAPIPLWAHPVRGGRLWGLQGVPTIDVASPPTEEDETRLAEAAAWVPKLREIREENARMEAERQAMEAQEAATKAARQGSLWG